MSSLASRLGVASSASGESLDFFARVLESRELLRAAVRSEYSVPSGDDVDGMHRTLVQLYDLDASAAGRERAAMDQLDDAVDVEISPMPGLITLYTRAASPELATQINRRLLDLLDEFNVHRRQSQAAAERRFIQSRLEEAQRELIEAESALQSFLDQNRRYEESPQLRFEAGRLQRQVDLRQAVYTSLMQSLEQARMDEVRNTPVVTVVDPPEGSVRGDGRSVVRAMLIASLLGTILGLGVAFGREVMRTQRERHPGDYAEFLTLLRGRSGASANRAPEDPEVQEEDRGSGSNFAAS